MEDTALGFGCLCCLAFPLDCNLFKDWLVLYYPCSILLNWNILDEVGPVVVIERSG